MSVLWGATYARHVTDDMQERLSQVAPAAPRADFLKALPISDVLRYGSDATRTK